MHEPKILYWDLETGGVNALRADLGFVLCFGYKWAGERNAHCLTLKDFSGFKLHTFDDTELVRAALKIMEKADLLVAHYGDKFDRRFFQGRCVIDGLKPPPPTKQRDTCRIARTAFNFSSNRLGHLAKVLKCKHQKRSRGWPDWWLRVLAGDKDTLDKMAHYCKGDVQTLEDVYMKLRVYDNPHPRLVMDRSKCGLCGGAVEYRGFAYVGLYRYRRYVCHKCGRWGKEEKRAA